ncbi:MAG: hypothetical protein JO372_13200 [Solirubrobacterales bacterium]|nr:hypothetical protein [Solirubrobacterales bacterium]
MEDLPNLGAVICVLPEAFVAPPMFLVPHRAVPSEFVDRSVFGWVLAVAVLVRAVRVARAAVWKPELEPPASMWLGYSDFYSWRRGIRPRSTGATSCAE